MLITHRKHLKSGSQYARLSKPEACAYEIETKTKHEVDKREA